MSSYLRGITLLLAGPSQSGKTSFLRYLRYGRLSPELRHGTTLGDTPTAPLTVTMDQDQRLQLHVRRSLDPPGQAGAKGHADLMEEKRPHAILLILDSTSPSADLRDWTSRFCRHAERVFLESLGYRKELRSIIVCLNKFDKKRGRQYFSARRDAVQTCLRDGLANALGRERVDTIQILPCVSVRTSQYGTQLIDDVIAELAMQVK